MNQIQNLFNEKLISSLGWTLIHSLWQIALIGLLLKIGLIVFKRKTAEFRYLLSIVSLTAIVFLAVFTFTKLFITDRYYIVDGLEEQVMPAGVNIQTSSHTTETMSTSEKGINTINSIIILINSNLQFIVMLWLLGTVLLSAKFAGNFLYMNRLKKLKSYPAPKNIIQMGSSIAVRLNLRKKIQILESAIVKMPMVLGHLKPVILLPVGLAATLPTDQVEAILVHEIAHIRRNDYLINLLKSLIEVAFFYHPVIWWISSSLETEREHCCDDITQRICGSEKSLQKALLNLQQFGQFQPELATALINNKYKLLNRIMRMKTTNQFKHGIKGSLVGFVVIVTGMIILATSSAFAPKITDLPGDYRKEHLGLLSENLISALSSDVKPSEGQMIGPVVYSVKQANSGYVPDTTIKKAGTSKAADSDKVTIELDGNYNLISVKKDGMPLEGDEMKEYEAMADKLKKLNEQEKKQEEQKAALEKAEKEFQAAQQQMEKAQQEYEKAISDYHEDFIYSDDSLNTQVFVWTDKTSRHPKTLREIRIEKLPEIPDIPEIYTLKLSENELAEALEEGMADVNFDIQMDQLENELKIVEMEKEFNDQKGANKIIVKTSGSDDLVPTLRRELVKDGILKDKDDNMSFSLSQDELEVNGKKLSEDLHKKYLKIYKLSTGNTLEGKFKIEIKD